MLLKKVLVYFLSLTLFAISSYVFYGVFGRFTIDLLFDVLGKPGGGEIGLAYAFITVASSLLGAFFGIAIVFIILHRLGRRWKVSVFRPTLFGFLTFLLLLFLYILYLGR